MSRLEIPAYAKINWSLLLTGQRADGYHLLCSLMEQLALADEVSLETAPYDQISCPGLPEDSGNLAFKAWLALKSQFAVKDHLKIVINKQIPLAAGLAGGSADAAAVLSGANRLLGLDVPQAALLNIGAALGADVPFCLTGGAAAARGIGEVLSPLDNLPALPILLINPGCRLATKDVFAAARLPRRPLAATEALLQELTAARRQGDSAKIAELWQNDLQEAAIRLCPAVGQLIDDLAALGLPALMSGSGASVFAVCDDLATTERLKQKYSLVVATKTIY